MSTAEPSRSPCGGGASCLRLSFNAELGHAPTGDDPQRVNAAFGHSLGGGTCQRGKVVHSTSVRSRLQGHVTRHNY